jgi:hypothetical protein
VLVLDELTLVEKLPDINVVYSVGSGAKRPGFRLEIAWFRVSGLGFRVRA